MTAYEPHPDSPEPKDGDRVRVGDGPVEGAWHSYNSASPQYDGYITLDDKDSAFIVKGCPVTVLRRKECDHRWVYHNYGQYVCRRCGLHVERLVPEREPVDMQEVMRVFWDNPGSHGIRAVLEWAGVPVKDPGESS